MLFNSYQFAIFFPLVALGYFLAPYQHRWALLLVASYYFYMCAIPEYALLLLSATTIDYFVGLGIASAQTSRKKFAYLMISLVANLGTLFFFKYFNFFMDSLANVTTTLGIPVTPPESSLLLPVGLSFFIFQTMSYTIDVYRGHLVPERHFGKFALYISFFPQLVAGPIERSTNLLPQFRQNFDFNYERVVGGVQLIAWGFFKKIVIADQLATLVDAVYNSPHDLTGVHFTVATIFFAFQIYCDFSGYSDIAIGAAQVLGYRLMINFDRPYAARSIAEFWSRWHISLSTWFRDYLYIPLGGNRVSVGRWYSNLLIVFVVSGLWHGASWNYVIWGALHATFLIATIASKNVRTQIGNFLGISRFPNLHACCQRLVVFSLVCLAWIFFRANTFSDAVYMLTHLGTGWNYCFTEGWLREAFEQIGISRSYLWLSIALIVVLEVAQSSQMNHRSPDQFRTIFVGLPTPIRWAAYVCLTLAIVNFGAPKAAPFVYFQF